MKGMSFSASVTAIFKGRMQTATLACAVCAAMPVSAMPVSAMAATAAVDPAYYAVAATIQNQDTNFCSSTISIGNCTSSGPTSGSTEELLDEEGYSGSAGASASGAVTPGVVATAALYAAQLEKDGSEGSPVTAAASGGLSYSLELVAKSGNNDPTASIPVLMNGLTSITLTAGDEDNYTTSTVTLQVTGPGNSVLYGLPTSGYSGSVSSTLDLTPGVEYTVSLNASVSAQVVASEEQNETEIVDATVDPVFTISDPYSSDYQLVFSPDIGNSPATTGSVPEPASWAMMLAGFSALGVVLRGGRRKALAAA